MQGKEVSLMAEDMAAVFRHGMASRGKDRLLVACLPCINIMSPSVPLSTNLGNS